MTTVEISYAAVEGVLTATLGVAERLDTDELIDEIVLSFDAAELGRLVDIQVLVPSARDGAWRAILSGCLGASFGGRCLEVIDGDEDLVREEMAIPATEWRVLRDVQWPTLHQSWRRSNMLAPLALPSKRTAARSVVAAGVPVDADAAGALRSVVVLPRAIASKWSIGETIEVTLDGANAHLVARFDDAEAEADRAPSLAAVLLSPRPRSDAPVSFRRSGGALTADVALRDPIEPHRSNPVLVRLDSAPRAKAPAPAAASSRFRCVLRDAGRAARDLFGVREVAVGGVSFSGVRIGRTADRLYWERTGRPPIEVVVFREGAVLWARGFAKKSRRSMPVRVTCELRPEAVAALQPNGRTDEGAGRLDADGSVDHEGMFQIRLASVTTTRFTGDLLEHLQLDIG